MNKLHVFLALIFVLAGIMETAAREQVEPQTLAIGAKAPGFRLKVIDDKYYTLESFSKADILLIVFSAPHCPTAGIRGEDYCHSEGVWAKRSAGG
jgi:hypothetical protein